MSALVRTRRAANAAFEWAALPAAINRADWGIQTAATGVNVLRYIPPSEWPAIFAGTSNYDATADIQAAIDSGATDVQLPEGKLEFNQIIHRPGLMRLTGRGQATGGSGTYLKRRAGATGPAYVWDGATRIIGAEIGGFRMDCNSEAGETYGLDLSGFSYCTFKNIWVRLAKLDGIYVDGSITPINKQFSNNTFINVRANNNLRDGWQFDGSSQANSANTYIGCEGAGNAGVGFNELVGYANQTIGCTFQGNTVRDLFTNGSRNRHEFYAEGNPKPVELGAASFANELSVRSSYPLWNTFVDAGVANTLSVRGEVEPERHVFDNPFFLNWTGATPANVALNGAPVVASFTDNNSPANAGLLVTVGANFQGLIFTLDESAAQLKGRWVTLVIEVDTSGVVDPIQTRVYARDGAANNGATGEFAAEYMPISQVGQFVRLAYDVKFPAAVAGVPSVLWYLAYSGVAAGGNAIKIRSARIVVGQTRDASQFVGVEAQHAATTATLAAASNGINTHRKFAGRIAYETSTGKMRYATAALPSSPWRAFDGSGDLVPA